MYCAIHPYIIMPIVLILSCLFWLWRSSKKKSEQNKSHQIQNYPSVSAGELLGFVHVHKCSKCGWGMKVSVFNKVVTCPQCGNVDENIKT